LLADIMCAHFMCLEIRHEKHAYRNQPKHYYDHNLLVSHIKVCKELRNCRSDYANENSWSQPL